MFKLEVIINLAKWRYVERTQIRYVGENTHNKREMAIVTFGMCCEIDSFAQDSLLDLHGTRQVGGST